jgi:peptidoglycan/xylan/chitin deacetylase (PgdA/CDA1 family)
MGSLRRRAARRWAGSNLNLLGTLVRVQTTCRVAALTFDDGPDPEFTPTLLEILDRHGARATFFVVGTAAAEHPRIVEQIHEAGHTVAHHSWDHPDFTRISGVERRDQLRKCSRQIAEWSTPLFRPPFGSQNRASRIDALRFGLDVVGWSRDIEDWLAQPRDELRRRLFEALEPGRIILLHDSIRGGNTTSAYDRAPLLWAIDAVLSATTDFEFVTIPELVASGAPVRVRWIHSD